MISDQRKLIYLTISAVIVTVALIFIFRSNTEVEEKSTSSDKFKLENILSANDENLRNQKVKKIFFIETHTEEERELKNPRQVCSIESAARTNPDMKIYFSLVTKSSGVTLKYSNLTSVLSSYPNIQIRYLNPIEFSKGTKLEEFFAQDRMKNSSNPLEHLSDILRILLLNKYGGQYLDLDVLSLTPLSEINRNNFACPETKNTITNAIINLDLEGGKAISDLYLKTINKKYDPYTWAGNGGFMLTSSVRAFCNNSDIPNNIENRCGNFTTFPSVKCYPYNYGGWKKVFQEDAKNEVLERIKSTGAFFFHIWNKMQDFDKTHFELSYNSTSAYIQLAKVRCPKTFEAVVNSGSSF